VRSIDVFCVFPEAVDAAVGVGVVGRAIENGIVGYRSFDLREYSPDGRIDDMPYGGGGTEANTRLRRGGGLGAGCDHHLRTLRRDRRAGLEHARHGGRLAGRLRVVWR